MELSYDPLDTDCFHYDFQDSCYYIEIENTLNISTQARDLTVLQLNCRGLLSKQRNLSRLLYEILGENNKDVVLLCETWLTKESEKRVMFPGYTYYGQSRKNKKGSGVGF